MAIAGSRRVQPRLITLHDFGSSVSRIALMLYFAYEVIDRVFEIDLAPETVAVLSAEAEKKGISIQELARAILEVSLAVPRIRDLAPDEEERLLDELAAIGAGLPPVPLSETYSRDTICAEHD
ncbi:MAG: hypothetical protein KGJ62_01015 [Armatimonadetes bacterium]|nr:hypothetical protein [Armatimonadota bacterium]MDE2207780.1 hypothetical protein [Armatimonadota bacterium]